MREIPDCRLFIKNPSLTDKATRERFLALFEAEGIDGERLDMFGYMPDDSGHLAAYARMDIALDTFPYNGTTTTCEALWMGVPVVSLRGDRHSARVGASLLAAAGCAGWVVDSAERYMQVAMALSRDRNGLVGLRSGLRERVRNSSLCAAAEHARGVEIAYEEMYEAWLNEGAA
jgi:predicted O-linked N-acetylglucosamine transferase (SPINDLY family)